MAESEHIDQQFLELVVKSIVDNPDDVEVTRQVDEMGVLLILKVNSRDMGQVVGRQGSTAKAIRSLLKIVGIKNNARVNLKIEEPEGGRGPSRERREDRPTYSRSESTAEDNEDEGEVDQLSGTMVGQVIEDIKKDL